VAPPPAPGAADGFVGPWKATMTADYSTCADVKPAQKRVVTWIIANDKGGTLSATEKGGAKADPGKYSGKLSSDGRTLELRAGAAAGLDLVVDGATLVGRHVAVRKGNCAVLYTLRAERATDVPMDVGDTDPDAGTWTLDKATAGLPPGKQLYADIVTDAGTLTCELAVDRAPVTVANFVGLARGLRAWKDPATGRWVRYRAYYDGLGFHRVIPSFIVQGGDPLSRDWSNAAIGTGGPGYTIPDETSNGLRFDTPGRLAMANRGPNTGTVGSQFFVSEVRAPQLDGGYTVFGQCGPIDVVSKMARVPASAQTNKPDMPLTMKVVIHR
jgi:peptidyl-prolyl cis-trans isomerase A (cyclophilin A)